MYRHILLLIFSLIVTNSVRSADAQERPFARMPWHLVDLWWDLGKDQSFESYSIDVTFSDNVPATTNLYVAPLGLGHLNKTPFYGGIQTQADGNTKSEPQLRKIGPGFLMSMWGERRLDAIRPSLGGFFQSSGHEGDFVSVRYPYAWTKGTYTYRVVKMEKEIVDDKPTTWVGAFVFSHDKHENIFVGALRFPGEQLVLSRKVASFVEIYGGSIPVEQIPKLTVTFGQLKVNGEPKKNPAVEAIYPKDVPDFAKATWNRETVTVEVGPDFGERKARRVKLNH